MIDDYFNVCYTWNYTQMFIQFYVRCYLLLVVCVLPVLTYCIFAHSSQIFQISIKILPPSCLILSRTYHEVGDKRKDIHGVILSVVCYFFIHSMSKSLAKIQAGIILSFACYGRYTLISYYV